jgi:hypothetical protein
MEKPKSKTAKRATPRKGTGGRDGWMVRKDRSDDGKTADVRDVRQAGVPIGSPERGVLMFPVS